MTDKEIIACIRTLTPENDILNEMITEIEHPVSLQLKEEMQLFSMKDVILYDGNGINLTNDDLIKVQILRSQHNSKMNKPPVH